LSARRHALALAALAAPILLLAAGSARADGLEGDLSAVWEAAWDERGTPLRLTRWEQPIRYRFSGPDAQRHRGTVVAALILAAQLAGVAVSESEPGADGATAPNLEIEMVDEHALPPNVGCDVRPRHAGFALVNVRLRLRGDQTWNCAYHEMMHVMGVPGHPSGPTVLSYFPWRRDTLMDLDRQLLAIWYDGALERGATPFDVLWVGGLRLAQQVEDGHGQAHRRRQAHYDARVREMASFARGEGDVPTIIKRSGRASTGHIEAARTLMAYYLGLAYQRSVGMPRDDAQAAAWFGQAARAAHHPSQVLLARALIRGEGVPADAVEAHRWLASAKLAGNALAPAELASLEKSMDSALLERARALGPHAPRAPQ
jgi:Sel1 repeat